MKPHLIPITSTLVLAVALAGCNADDGPPDADHTYHESVSSPAEMGGASLAHAPQPAMMRGAMGSVAVNSAPTQETVQERRIAEVQSWQYELSPKALKSTWEAQRDACLTLNQACEILQANLATRGHIDGAQHGTLELRVARAALQGFEAALESTGPAPAEKSVFREDRTLQWTDLQSRKQSAEQLRDRLQAMVTNHQTDKLGDLLALERELNRVQSTLDSMTAQARVMAGETEKVRINISYRSTPQTVAQDIWHPIRDAWHDMGSTFAHSVAGALLFVAGSLPWIVIIVPLWVGLRKAWGTIKRRLAGKRHDTQSA